MFGLVAANARRGQDQNSTVEFPLFSKSDLPRELYNCIARFVAIAISCALQD
jgi:hypothetical protein